jgi:hypothetical protein
MLSPRTQSKTILHAFAAMLLLFIAAVVMTHTGTLDAQTVNWVPTGSPSARCCMGMAYDPATRSTVLFGGSDSGASYGDTWTWRGGWLQTSPVTSPSPRYFPGMAFDGVNIMLFGGIDSAGTVFNDTWTWDGTTWTQQFPAVSPPPNNCMGMVYDAATGTVVLFGGANSAGMLGDTWTWDGVSKTWTEQNPAASPSARSAPIAYDATTQTVLLFGGNGSTTAEEFNDTWIWNGTTWTQQFPATAPPARESASMTYDASIGAAVLFGGYAGTWENSLNDTWIWNGNTWREIHPATAPPNRYNFAMNYDPINRVVIMFGGYSSTVVRGDTWLLAIEP